MILEATMLQVRSGEEENFEQAFRKSSSIISSMKGYISHNLQKCIEENGKYLLQ